MARGGAGIGLGALFGLASALSWGAGDFCGGLISRYTSVLAAMLASQGLGFFAVLAVLSFSGESAPGGDSVLWALFAGFSGVGGLGFFYLALSRGTMGVVAPLAALIGAGVPVLVAIASGEPAPLLRISGIGLALLAVVLISVPSKPADAAGKRALRLDLRELPVVVLAGLGFAGFFIGIDQASSVGAIWWPLTIVRLAGLALVVGAIAVSVARGRSGHWSGRAAQALGVDRFRASGRGLSFALPLFALTGMGDLGGNVFFVLARQTDALSVAVVLSSLYPVVTTLLAALFLHERLSRGQLAGVVLATLSVPLLR
ncbi:MAG: EamA family transporter [Candidatus Limnocylindrales bacterium]